MRDAHGADAYRRFVVELLGPCQTRGVCGGGRNSFWRLCRLPWVWSSWDFRKSRRCSAIALRTGMSSKRIRCQSPMARGSLRRRTTLSLPAGCFLSRTSEPMGSVGSKARLTVTSCSARPAGMRSMHGEPKPRRLACALRVSLDVRFEAAQSASAMSTTGRTSPRPSCAPAAANRWQAAVPVTEVCYDTSSCRTMSKTGRPPPARS